MRFEAYKFRQDHHMWDHKLKDDKHELIKTSKMFSRRLESTIGKMPKEWFSHCNFAFSDLTPGEPREVVFADGFKWRFTGYMVNPEYYAAK